MLNDSGSVMKTDRYSKVYCLNTTVYNILECLELKARTLEVLKRETEALEVVNTLVEIDPKRAKRLRRVWFKQGKRTV